MKVSEILCEAVPPYLDTKYTVSEPFAAEYSNGSGHGNFRAGDILEVVNKFRRDGETIIMFIGGDYGKHIFQTTAEKFVDVTNFSRNSKVKDDGVPAIHNKTRGRRPEYPPEVHQNPEKFKNVDYMKHVRDMSNIAGKLKEDGPFVANQDFVLNKPLVGTSMSRKLKFDVGTKCRFIKDLGKFVLITAQTGRGETWKVDKRLWKDAVSA